MLDTGEIDKFMKRLSKKYPSFIYVGALPADIHPKFTIDTDYDYGYIFNTDPIKKDGEHWVAVFVDNHPSKEHSKSVEYYDSMGMNPVGRIDRYIRKQFKGYKYKINDVIHQNYLIKKGRRKVINEMCGVYAIEFLRNRLKGKSFKEATNYKEPDDYIMDQFDVIQGK
jgi:Ulp1 family protease